MFGIALFTEPEDIDMDQWGYLLMAWKLQKNTWEIGGKYLRWANHVANVGELPKDVGLVLFNSRNSVFPELKGVISLETYWHADHAIYLFGPAHRSLTPGDMYGRTCAQRIVIETPGDNDLFPSTAAALAIWDRHVKGHAVG